MGAQAAGQGSIWHRLARFQPPHAPCAVQENTHCLCRLCLLTRACLALRGHLLQLKATAAVHSASHAMLANIQMPWAHRRVRRVLRAARASLPRPKATPMTRTASYARRGGTRQSQEHLPPPRVPSVVRENTLHPQAATPNRIARLVQRARTPPQLEPSRR